MMVLILNRLSLTLWSQVIWDNMITAQISKEEKNFDISYR